MIKAFLVSMTIALAVGICSSASAASSTTYLHADNCAARLHGTGVVGDYEGDNDVHLYGQSHGYIWYYRGVYWHPNGAAEDVMVREWYQYNSATAGIVTVSQDMECHGTDYLSWDRPYNF